MKPTSSLLIGLLLRSVPACVEGFAGVTSIRMPWSNQAANPKIEQFALSQVDQLLRIRLNLGNEADESRLAIDGILLELGGRDQQDRRRLGPLPGANGPNPDLSSGARVLNLLEDGSFVDLTGKRTVELSPDGSCWEMIWRKDAPAGALICAFDAPQEIRRNKALLPKGRFYMTLPVWTGASLEQGRQVKAKVIERASQYQKEKEEEMRIIAGTTNPLVKALHYRRAYAAAEKYFLSGISRMDEIPDDADVVRMGGVHDLLLCKRGTVWTKNIGFGGVERVLLGAAHASLEDQES